MMLMAEDAVGSLTSVRSFCLVDSTFTLTRPYMQPCIIYRLLYDIRTLSHLTSLRMPLPLRFHRGRPVFLCEHLVQHLHFCQHPEASSTLHLCLSPALGLHHRLSSGRGHLFPFLEVLLSTLPTSHDDSWDDTSSFGLIIHPLTSAFPTHAITHSRGCSVAHTRYWNYVQSLLGNGVH